MARAATDRAGARKAARAAVRAVLAGSGAVALTTGTLVAARGGRAIPGGGEGGPSEESVLRFYAVWWATAGAVMVNEARRDSPRSAVVNAVAGATFAGGLARLAATRRSGWPHPLFRVLTAAELVTPPALLAAQRIARAETHAAP